MDWEKNANPTNQIGIIQFAGYIQNIRIPTGEASL